MKSRISVNEKIAELTQIKEDPGGILELDAEVLLGDNCDVVAGV
jgi:hypothetical protein